MILLLLLFLRCLVNTTDGLACMLLTRIMLSEESETREHMVQLYKQQLPLTQIATTLQTARKSTAELACFEASRLSVNKEKTCQTAV